MLITNLNRVQLLSVLPEGGVVAEVGVANGGFAGRILNTLAPTSLHLIDPWGRDEDDTYLTAYNVPRSNMLESYERVRSTLGEHIAKGQVVLHRDYSTVVAPTFRDHTFDWIYIDGAHDYGNVLADLLAFRDKVKPDGYILGHDFSNSTLSRRRKFGVVQAVREFMQREKFNLVLLTNESAPTYLLARSNNDTVVPALLNALMNRRGSSVIQLRDSQLDQFEQIEILCDGPGTAHLMTFG